MFELKGEKEPISVIIVIICHFIIGAGIAVIGQRTKNTFEFIGGILFILFMIATFFIPLLALVRVVLILLSWVYLAMRLVRISRSKEVEIKIL